MTVPPDIGKLFINNNELGRVNSTVFLGITLCDNLSWQNHINIITSKINKLRGILYLTRNNLTKESMRTIYYSLVYSNIIYCNVLWGKSPVAHLKSLEVAHKKIIRTIMYRGRFDHTNNDFISLNILKLNDINKFVACCFVYKSLNLLSLPEDYFHFVDDLLHGYNLRNLNQLKLRMPSVNSLQGKSSPSYYACEFWNSLPLEIKTKPSLYAFKRALKDLIIDSYRML